MSLTSDPSTSPQSRDGLDVGPATPDVQPARPRLGRIAPVFLVAHFGWMLPVAAGGTLIQALMEQIDADAKVALYAVLSVVGAVAGMLANIVFGALSDRTRTRWGSRNPWILVGGLVAAAAVMTMSVAPSFALLVVLWGVFQVSLNAFLGPLIAILADRVAPESLGKASSVVGVGQLLAQSLGGVVAASFLAVPRDGLKVVPLTLVVAALVVFFFARDTDNRGVPRPALNARELLATFRVPRDADFLWALAGRFLLLLSFMLVVLYQLFVLTDYVGLTTEQAAPVIATGGLIMAASSGLSTLVSGPLSDWLGRRKALVMGASFVLAFATVPLAVSPTVTSFYLFLAVGGFAYGIYVAVDQALMAEVLPDQENRAKDLGILNVANTGPQILAPVIAGVIVSLAGYRGIFVTAIVVAIVSALCIKPIRRVR
ncbi:Major Facilitator Superfamily transporter [Sanguibacter keddieii DSM 10542]|uniref:Major Facilitator Superfamily transporter n=1 Tax=Sanguibacter keddieii (strain ATCC 51767 / DSM 10542 / NCFB 3025 / ST-74) TaxID=446469 RepID=D1BJI4_SANKS|nr:MFS transporter [Sanguibacter keddieii]ACZ20240.1 Major Facilitator Superfamily transporter [Sanguibacter keddieii DSM 10542]